MTDMDTRPRNRPRSIAAFLIGFISVGLLSLGTDQVLHVLHVYPPWGQPMNDPGLNLLALAYRCIYSILGSFIAAAIAPRNPMRHAMALGWVGLVLSTFGVIAALKMNLGPIWYPIGIVLSAVPCAWLGGVLHRMWREKRAVVAA